MLDDGRGEDRTERRARELRDGRLSGGVAASTIYGACRAGQKGSFCATGEVLKTKEFDEYLERKKVSILDSYVEDAGIRERGSLAV